MNNSDLSILTETNFIIFMTPLIVWDICWKGVALWRAANKGQKNWFIALLVFNTLGILPISYLKFFQKPKP